MEILKLIPRGFCSGVVNSIRIAKEVAIKHFDKNIYMIGMLVHNKIIIDELTSLNIVLIDDIFKSRIEIINELPNDSVIIFSAHGTNLDVVNLAKKRNMIVYDTVCEWVEYTRQIIIKNLNKNKKIIFIGKKNHPETIALTSIDKENIILIENVDDIDNLKISEDEQVFATNQTTLSKQNTKIIYDKLIYKFKNIEYSDDICQATSMRQQAVLDLKGKKIDLLIVVGDVRSSNTKELVETGNSINIPSVRVNSIEELDVSKIKKDDVIAVTAGASTSNKIVMDVITKLENLN